MNVITINNKRYEDINTFKLSNNINSDKTVYNWVTSGKAEQIKRFNKSFFRLS